MTRLAGLRAVPWAKLTHAYGDASDVPDLLEQLRSDDADERNEAIHALFGNIWHQGTVYEATAHAVPFLGELLAAPEVEDRVSIALLLGEIARGKSYAAVHRPDDAAAVARETAWVRAAREAVRGQLDACLALLADPGLRLPAACVLAAFPGDAARIAPALRQVLAGARMPRTRASLGLALALLGEAAPEAFAGADTDEIPLARLGRLAAKVLGGEVERDDAAEILGDLAVDEFDEAELDDLGLA